MTDAREMTIYEIVDEVCAKDENLGRALRCKLDEREKADYERYEFVRNELEKRNKLVDAYRTVLFNITKNTEEKQ